MKVIAPTYGEIVFKNCMQLLSMNYLTTPQYYTQLFQTFKLMLVEEHIEQLDEMIAYVEQQISDRYNPITLSEAETYMWNNMDLYSGFMVNGVIVTQQEIFAMLDEIKEWLRSLISIYLPRIRFTVQMRD